MQSTARPLMPSDHFDGRLFHSPGGPPLPRLAEVLRWQLTRRPPKWPKWVEIQTPRELPAVPTGGLSATWINHSTVLLRADGLTILTDPVFSPICGPFGRIGPRRVHAPGVPFDLLPRVDVVAISHDHYDHFDLATLRRLARRDQPVAIMPLANFSLLRRAGFERIVELDWWETHSASARGNNVNVTAVPAQHWSNRLRGKRSGRLWAGFHFSFSKRTAYFAGDTGYNPNYFKDIHDRFGSPDLALIPIGAYEPRWFMKGQHCNPAEAVQIHLDIQAKRSLAIHWGTFQLTDERRDDPPEALKEAARRLGLVTEAFSVVEPGQSIVV
jgi:L-ascorbate metabolism protein UlaG (beta-lactamase superfamily)